jgi:hypothetical protein
MGTLWRRIRGVKLVLVALVCALGASTALAAAPTSRRVVAPPPATLRAAGHTFTLAKGSYCWTDPSSGAAACADMIPPPTRTDLARVVVPRGARMTVRLRFVAKAWTAGLWARKARQTLPPGRTATIVARTSGILTIDITKSAGGSASYLARLVVR